MRERKEIMLPKSQIINLTMAPISSYTNDGSITTLNPAQPEEIIVNSENYYIVETIPQGIKLKCLKALGPFQGRGGVEVSALVLYEQQDIRVYPTEG